MHVRTTQLMNVALNSTNAIRVNNVIDLSHLFVYLCQRRCRFTGIISKHLHVCQSRDSETI